MSQYCILTVKCAPANKTFAIVSPVREDAYQLQDLDLMAHIAHNVAVSEPGVMILSGLRDVRTFETGRQTAMELLKCQGHGTITRTVEDHAWRVFFDRFLKERLTFERFQVGLNNDH